MSAMKDSAQGTTFIYTHFYQLYRKSRIDAESRNELAKGVVLAPTPAKVRVVSSQQNADLSRWSHATVNSHFRSLRESRKRLQFLMSEIDDILKQG